MVIGRGGWGPATGVLSKELGHLSRVSGRLSNGFVTFLFSIGRAEDADANHVVLDTREGHGPAVAHFRHCPFYSSDVGGAALRSAEAKILAQWVQLGADVAQACGPSRTMLARP